MTEYIKVVLESDSAKRIGISVLDVHGAGHGYRITGPKYVNDLVNGHSAKVLASAELDDRDVGEIRSYLRQWDVINLTSSVPTELLATQKQFPEYQDKPHNVERNQKVQDVLLAAVTAVVETMRPAATP